MTPMTAHPAPARPVYCQRCRALCPEPPPSGGASGYAVTQAGACICYDCAHADELKDIATRDSFLCYVSPPEGQPCDHYDKAKGYYNLPARLTTWPGHPISERASVGPAYKVPAFHCPSTRRAVRAVLPDGSLWFGTYYQSSGDYARMKRSHQQMTAAQWIGWY